MPTRREELMPMMDMLDAASSALRRDECGDYRINGSRGHIFPWGDGQTWWVMFSTRSKQHWTWTKKRLPFVQITQDGDEEGAGRMGSTNPEQAALIREICGIRKRPDYSADSLAEFKSRLPSGGTVARFDASNDEPGS